MEPPVAPVELQQSERHGRTVVDPWHWLADRDDPRTIAYLQAENEFADDWLAPLAAQRQQIFDEIRSRTQETDLSVPTRKGPWWYATRTVEGLAYPIHVRGRSEAEASSDEAAVLLDENVEAKGHDYFAVGAFDLTVDHRWLAWSRDIDGSEVYELLVRDLETGTDLPFRVERTYYGTAWSSDGNWLFYTVPDEAMRPFQVRRRSVDSGEDVLVLEEADERFNVSLGSTRSEAWVVISADSRTTSEAWVIPADKPEDLPRSVAGRVEGVELAVDHWHDRFVILTNAGAPDFRVVTAPVDTAGPDQWVDLVEHVPGRRLHDVDAFASHLVVHAWEEAVPSLRIVYLAGGSRSLTFDEAAYDVGPSANPEYASTTLRFKYESLTTPATIYDEEVVSGQRALRKRAPVLGGFDPATYQSARVWAPAPDGERVPVDLVWHRDTPIDGTAPCVVYGYGAYEASLAPWFSVARLSLLDRGVVWALAHPRGGGELGRAWYEQGRLRHKRNSFTDFIAAAEHLVDTKFAAPNRLAARGGSAGGLLVAGAMSLRPDLFAAVVAEVPFVDVVTTLLDPSLPLTITEWEEWGDPRDPADEAYITSYSPYENVPVRHPALLVTAGLNDPRVAYHEPAKWVARLRAESPDGGPIVLQTQLGAGHGGPSGRYEAWREEARTLAFLLKTLDVGR
jgi:oligopeptidase B